MAGQLATVHRWCVTGTPIAHGIEDLYGLLVFLQAAPFADRSLWLNVLRKVGSQRPPPPPAAAAAALLAAAAAAASAAVLLLLPRPPFFPESYPRPHAGLVSAAALRVRCGGGD